MAATPKTVRKALKKNETQARKDLKGARKAVAKEPGLREFFNVNKQEVKKKAKQETKRLKSVYRK